MGALEHASLLEELETSNTQRKEEVGVYLELVVSLFKKKKFKHY